jgi:hypothetical protein
MANDTTLPPNASTGNGDMADQMVAEMNAATSAAPAAAPTEPTSAPVTETAPTAPPAPPEAKPASTPSSTAKVAPAAKPAPAQAKPVAPVLDWKTAPKQFKEAHEALKSRFESTERELKGKLFTTEQSMKQLEAKKFLTPEQEAKYAKLETRQQQLEAELYSRDYREAPEFKAKYQAKADKIFQTVQTELKGIQVTENDVQRPATLADFGKIRSFGDSQVEQRRQAKALFGEDADVVLSLARELKGIEDAANDEITAKRNGFQSERQQQQQRFQSELQTGQKVFGEYDKLLVEKFPQYFAPIEGNDEFNQALQQGVQFVDSNSTGFNQKSPEQRAQSSALIRRWASAWPANQILIKQNTAKIAELEATVLKLQGSDPGAGGESGGGMQAGGEEVGGTDAMSNEIGKLMQQV